MNAQWNLTLSPYTVVQETAKLPCFSCEGCETEPEQQVQGYCFSLCVDGCKTYTETYTYVAYQPHDGLLTRTEQLLAGASKTYEAKGVNHLQEQFWEYAPIGNALLLIRTPVKANNDLLLFTSIEMQYGTNETVAKWRLLKRSAGEIFSEGSAYPENKSGYGVTKQPVLVGDRAFIVAHDDVFCVSMTEGKELWRVVFSRDMLTSMPIASKDGLFCPMEDGYVCKLDLDSGKIVWKAKISATPSRPVNYQRPDAHRSRR